MDLYKYKVFTVLENGEILTLSKLTGRECIC